MQTFLIYAFDLNNHYGYDRYIPETGPVTQADLWDAIEQIDDIHSIIEMDVEEGTCRDVTEDTAVEWLLKHGTCIEDYLGDFWVADGVPDWVRDNADVAWDLETAA